MRFELTRDEPIRLAGERLNHSATSTLGSVNPEGRPLRWARLGIYKAKSDARAAGLPVLFLAHGSGCNDKSYVYNFWIYVHVLSSRTEYRMSALSRLAARRRFHDIQVTSLLMSIDTMTSSRILVAHAGKLSSRPPRGGGGVRSAESVLSMLTCTIDSAGAAVRATPGESPVVSRESAVAEKSMCEGSA